MRPLPHRFFTVLHRRPLARATLWLVTLLLLPAAAFAATNVGGNITTDTTWTLAGSPYIVTSTITVQGVDGADAVTTLTIEPGVEVRFNRYQYMNIGASTGNPGALRAQGTAGSSIIFTSNQATPAAGDWYGLRFHNTTVDASTILEYCAVRYAGGGSQGNIILDQASPALENLAIAESLYYGIQISSGAPLIDGCQFTNNLNYDLYYSGTVGGSVNNCAVTSGIYLLATGSVAFTNNTVSYNNAFPIKAYADMIGALVNGNTFNNVNAASVIEVSAGTVSRDATWSAAVPYKIVSGVTVQGTDGADAVTTLTIAPGAVLKFNRYQSLTIGASSGNPGALVAQGTASNPIQFTSSQATPAAGDWYGIKFQNTAVDATSKLEQCTIQYAGGGNQGNIILDQASPALKNLTIANSMYYGIQITNGAPVIDTCQFSGNANYDLYYTGTVGGTVSNCAITSGVYLLAQGNVAFTNNTVSYNNSFPIKAYADMIGPIVNGCAFSNVNAASFVEINYGTVSRDATWTAVVPYKIIGGVTVQGTDGADAVTTLTIAPGAVLKFNQYQQLGVGAASGNPGALKAQGTAENPILFTSALASPVAGNWNGVRFYNTANDTTCILGQAVVEYAGYGSQGAVQLQDAKPTIAYSALRYNAHAGVQLSGAGCNGAQITCNTFGSNVYGIHCAGALPQISQNNFVGNSSYGVYYTGSTILNVENNWWNAAQGPNGTGDKTYGNVDSNPWSTVLNQCVPPTENHPPNTPGSPEPSANAIRVALTGGGLTLRWSGGDPDTMDTVLYDLYWGTSEANLALSAANIAAIQYQKTALTQGTTYYWRITAKDNRGLQTQGPVWRFTVAGNPPDLIVSTLTPQPAGHLQAGTSVTLTALVTNVGSGPVVDPFKVDFLVNSASIGIASFDQVIPAGGSVQAVKTWTYAGGNPTVSVNADSLSQVSEMNEGNNRFMALLSEVADNSAPVLISHNPSSGAYLKQIQQVTATLADSQSAVNDAAVIAGFSLKNGAQQPVAGNIVENNDTFTFAPAVLPLPDGVYQVSLTASDTYGNSATYPFSFTIDTQAPSKPVITGGNVASGLVRPRPVQNTAADFMAPLQGTRGNDTSLWINGVQRVDLGAGAWSMMFSLHEGDNPLEIWCVDQAGNRSPSEWVDIRVQPTSGLLFEYDDDGRVKRIRRSN